MGYTSGLVLVVGVGAGVGRGPGALELARVRARWRVTGWRGEASSGQGCRLATRKQAPPAAAAGCRRGCCKAAVYGGTPKPRSAEPGHHASAAACAQPVRAPGGPAAAQGHAPQVADRRVDAQRAGHHHHRHQRVAAQRRRRRGRGRDAGVPVVRRAAAAAAAAGGGGGSGALVAPPLAAAPPRASHFGLEPGEPAASHPAAAWRGEGALEGSAPVQGPGSELGGAAGCRDRVAGRGGGSWPSPLALLVSRRRAAARQPSRRRHARLSSLELPWRGPERTAPYRCGVRSRAPSRTSRLPPPLPAAAAAAAASRRCRRRRQPPLRHQLTCQDRISLSCPWVRHWKRLEVQPSLAAAATLPAVPC